MFSTTNPITEEEVLQNLQPQQEVSAQKHALDFFEGMKTSADGWERCVAALMVSSERSDEFRFFCLQVIEHFASNQYQGTPDEQRKIREFLSFWIRSQCEPRNFHQLSSYIGNKAAQIFALVFIRDYPTKWFTFFDDLVETLNLGPGAVDCFLRVLLAIHDEINGEGIAIARDTKQKERKHTIKLAIKETAVKLLVESWYRILKIYLPTDKNIAIKCLKVIGAYVSWVDVHLIADEHFIQPLVTAIMSKELRESAVDCLLEIAKKGMHPAAKIQLIEMVLSAMHKSRIADEIEDEIDFACKMSTLTNAIGLNLFDSISTISKSETPEQAKTLEYSIENIIPVMLQCLCHENQNVVTAITPFTREYILMLKTKASLTTIEIGYVQSILATTVHHMQYSDTYNFDLDGINEAEFDNYRKLLKVIFINLVGVNRELVMEYAFEYVHSALSSWRSTSFQKPEVALSLMYYIGEAIPGLSQAQWFQREPPTPSHMQKMMRLLMESCVSDHTHQKVNQQYLKTAVRFTKFFEVEPLHLPRLLEIFFDHRGLKHGNPRVRYCCGGQLLRFVKSLPKFQLHAYTVDILRSLKEILLECLQEGEVNIHVLRESANKKNQLHLYETAGIIITSSSYPSAQKAEALRELLSYSSGKFSETLAQLYSPTVRKPYEVLETELVHLIDIATHTSNVFTSYHQLMSNSCVEIFMHCLQLFIPCLQLPQTSTLIRTSVCQFLHRMVVCLEEHVLSYLPQATEGLLKSCDATAIQEYIQLLVQIIGRFKKDVLPFLEPNFKPIVHSIFAFLDCPMEENDENMRREKVSIYRSYFSLLQTIASHGIIIDTLNSNDTPFMSEVKKSVLRGASEMNDADAQKTCFTILKLFVQLWADKNEPHFIDFVYKSIVPACFTAPLNPHFDLEDVTCKLVLWEIAACMRTVYEKRGNELINFLQNDYYEIANVSREIMNKYCTALTTDKRQFRIGLKQFVTNARK